MEVCCAERLSGRLFGVSSGTCEQGEGLRATDLMRLWVFVRVSGGRILREIDNY